MSLCTLPNSTPEPPLCVLVAGLAQRELHIPGEVSGLGWECRRGVTAIRLHGGRYAAGPGRVGGGGVVHWVAPDSDNSRRGWRGGVAYFGNSGVCMRASETAAPAALRGVRVPFSFQSVVLVSSVDLISHYSTKVLYVRWPTQYLAFSGTI